MKENIFYLDAKNKIVDFLATEFTDFPIKLQNRFLNFFPEIVNYEEEGTKFKPKLLFTNNIDRIARALPAPKKIQLFHDKNEHNFASNMKSLIPFCKLDWCVYIEVDEEGVQYGIIRNINSIKEEAFEDVLFKNEPLKKAEKTFGIYVYAQNSFTVTMKSIRGNSVNVNFALDIKTVNDWDDEIYEFVEASFSKVKTTARKLQDLKTMYKNIFKNVLKNVRGAICVVVEKDYDHTQDEFLSDGIWLDEPICFSKLFLQAQNYNEPKLLAVSHLFMSMLDYDGITVVDNSGSILAYNIFVETNLKVSGNIIGGARKRAAYTIINSHKKGIVGVYFQSHDGEMFYAPVRK